MKLKGIDVSHHQGKIDWEKVKASGIDFAIVRVGYSNRNGNGGLNYDKRYVYNLQQCNRLGIPVGVYIYCYDRSANAAAITVKALMKTIKNYSLEYPVIYDIEYDNAGFSKSVNTEICKAAMKVIEDAGYYGMIYASKDFFINHLNISELKGTDKWEAAYNKVDNDLVINGIWQYTSKGFVPGIAGEVDLDYSYKDYAYIIKKAGLNGFKKSKSVIVTTPEESITVPETPAPVLTPEIKTEIKEVKTETVKMVTKEVTANKLNVRKGPGQNYSIIKVIVKGTIVNVVAENGDWTKIGNNEWVSSKYIK